MQRDGGGALMLDHRAALLGQLCACRLQTTTYLMQLRHAVNPVSKAVLARGARRALDVAAVLKARRAAVCAGMRRHSCRAAAILYVHVQAAVMKVSRVVCVCKHNVWCHMARPRVRTIAARADLRRCSRHQAGHLSPAINMERRKSQRKYHESLRAHTLEGELACAPRGHSCAFKHASVPEEDAAFCRRQTIVLRTPSTLIDRGGGCVYLAAPFLMLDSIHLTP
jgi:hypothetical protein